MKGKEGSGYPEGREAKSALASSGRGLDTSGEKAFFADVGWTATNHRVLWERSYASHFTRITTTQPYSAVAPYQCWGCMRVLGISPESYSRFRPLLPLSSLFSAIRSGSINI